MAKTLSYIVIIKTKLSPPAKNNHILKIAVCNAVD